jgi:HK97 family phage prohead protease
MSITENSSAAAAGAVEFEVLQADERPLLGRRFEAVDISADGRNIELLCAPFDVTATVADPPHFEPYEEEFARGAFAGATKAPNRVLLEFEHYHPGMSGILGHGAELEERDDALYGRFRVSRSVDGDKALELVHEGVLGAASVYFAPIKTAKLARGHVRRLKVMLDRVALCRVGAYPQAQVLAVRSQQQPAEQIVELPEQVQPLGFDPELATRLEAQGITLPNRMRHHTT